MERFLATACGMDFVSHTDVAADFSQAVAERAKAFPEFAEELQLFDARWIETLGGPIEENVALMRRLKASGRPGLCAEQLRHGEVRARAQHVRFPRRVRPCVISGHVGVVKPDPRIFEILFARVGKRPEELLFVDDSINNVEAARAAGMPTIHFKPGVDLESELVARGALPSSGPRS